MNLVREIVVARPRRADGRQAESASAAGEGRSDPGRSRRISRGSKSTTALIAEELNVKQVEFTEEAEKYITYRCCRTSSGSARGSASCCRRARQALGEGRRRQAAGRTERQRQSDARLSAAKRSSSTAKTSRFACKPSQAGPRRKARTCVVVLATELTPELIAEGFARDFVRLIQDRRKEMDLSTPIGSRSASRRIHRRLTSRLLCGETRIHHGRNARSSARTRMEKPLANSDGCRAMD